MRISRCAAASAVLVTLACAAGGPGRVTEIRSEKEFGRIFTAPGEKVLVFHLTRKDCYPCRQLKPLLREAAAATTNNARFYRIDVDRLPMAANMIMGGQEKIELPYVAFARNGEILYSVVGVKSKHLYMRAVNTYAEQGTELKGM